MDLTSDRSSTLKHSVDNQVPHKDEAQHEVPEIMQASNLPIPASVLPDLQTRQYSEELSTSTPIDVSKETPQRPHPAPCRTSSSYSPRPSLCRTLKQQGSCYSPKPAARTTHMRNNKSSQM